MAQTVIGMFDNTSEAQQAVERLTDKGFSRNNIDVTNPGISTAGSSDTHAEHGGSGIGNFFRSLFSDDDSDKYVHVAKHSKSIVTVHAQTSEEAEEAADILDDAGAVNVDERAASYGYTGRSGSGYSNDNTFENNRTVDYTGSNANLSNSPDYRNETAGAASLSSGLTTGSADLNSRTDDTDTTNDSIDRKDETTKIPIIEENIEIGKREVQTGGARLRSRIVERPVEESLRLREENVTVERTPVDRAATDADLQHFSDKQIEMTETAEVPVVNKEARVVEEVSLKKDVNERTETVSDTVRKTEVDVEKLDADRDTDRTDYTDRSNRNN